MATKISAVMNVTDQTGKKTTSRSITDVNPNATHADVSNFVKALNGLTNNILVSIELVTKTDITNAKLDPQLKVTPNVAKLVADEMTFTISYSGDGTITLSGKKPLNSLGGLSYNANTRVITKSSISELVPAGGDSFETYVSLSETDEYEGATVIITWTSADESSFEDI